MNKATLFFVLILSLTSFSQKGSLNLEFHTSFNFTVLNREPTSSILGYGIGFNAEFQQAKPVRFSLGVEYNVTRQKADALMYNGHSSPGTHISQTNLSFLSIPLRSNFYLGKRQRLLLNSGLALDFHLKEKAIADSPLKEGDFKTSLSPRIFNFSPIVGIGWVFPMEKIQLVVKTELRYGMLVLNDFGPHGVFGTNRFARLVFGMKF